MNKNQIFTGEITGCTSQGLGVARLEDRAVFVKGAIPGETCEIKIIKVTKTAVYGRLERILVASPHRVQPICPHFGKCGGCDFMHMDYQLESDLKRQRVADALSRIGGVDPEPLAITPAPTDQGYRNKAQFPVAMTENGPAAGFFRARSHDLIPVTHCHIQPPEADLAAQAVLDWMEKYHILPYDEATHSGYIRHIFLRKGAVSGQVMVCLVANCEHLPKSRQLVAQLLAAVPGLTTVVHNVNTRPGNAILGDTYHTLHGLGCIEDTLCGLTFRLSPASFYQVNHHQAQVLYEKAIALADLHGTETVLDLYCGTGTITLAMAHAAGQVIGVEVVPQAIADAQENARRNGIENARFFCADAGAAAQQLAQEGIRPEVITVDPPRKGLSPEVIDAVAKMAPQRVVYVSCDPATLARDVKRFAAAGYHFRTAHAVDLFPRTKHIETVVLLSKGEIDSKKIRVEFSLEDLDTSGLQRGATYGQIKERVLEQTGLKVSSLYIAQVKQKCGIIERENYNKPKSEDARQPQCPPEKEAAIMDALRHFGMIQ
jgi:23S rRNA (uracil1939-C5)-methyltransferase